GLVLTNTKPKMSKADPRYLPASFYQRVSQPGARLAPGAFKQQLTNNAARVFNLHRKLNADPAAASIAPAQAGGNLSWTQWSKDPQHTGFINLVGQSFDAVLGDIVYDPHAAAWGGDQGGDLLVHYQTPLTDGDDV